MKLRLTVFALCLLALSIGAFAQPAPSKAPSKATGKATAQPAQPATKPAPPVASRIFLDPVTGEAREPTPEEIRALQGEAKSSSAQAAKRRASAAAPAAREMVNADGAVGVDATDEQASFSVAHVHADGSVSHSCVDGAHSAMLAVKKGQPQRPATAPSKQ
ncbi:hypothetical protein J7U46_13700 [Pelomonas sp. V22]|uniref:post-PEP-CTERM-1 domain-containing protein n=1 Tax=Pelomonas sp. V22 TaxID=2822139 RepID=UPI0024A9D9FB|nr:hypothetical protein [Pelomonas sp. V22]MDI4634107.1 hypothetical protein [Pelomonas sp. V22]